VISLNPDHVRQPCGDRTAVGVQYLGDLASSALRVVLQVFHDAPLDVVLALTRHWRDGYLRDAWSLDAPSVAAPMAPEGRGLLQDVALLGADPVSRRSGRDSSRSSPVRPCALPSSTSVCGPSSATAASSPAHAPAAAPTAARAEQADRL
jgi:hypothetical protein